MVETDTHSIEQVMQESIPPCEFKWRVEKCINTALWLALTNPCCEKAPLSIFMCEPCVTWVHSFKTFNGFMMCCNHTFKTPLEMFIRFERIR